MNYQETSPSILCVRAKFLRECFVYIVFNARFPKIVSPTEQETSVVAEKAIANRLTRTNNDHISIVDLTGVANQDIQIAKTVNRLFMERKL